MRITKTAIREAAEGKVVSGELGDHLPYGVRALLPDATGTLAIVEQRRQVRWLSPGATAFSEPQSFPWSYGLVRAAAVSNRAVAILRYTADGKLQFGVETRP